MDKRLQVSFLFIASIAAIACFVLLSFFPAFPQSIVGWLSVFFVGAPLLLAGEYLVDLIFKPRFLNSWPSWARVFYGVVVTLVILGMATPVIIGVAKLIAS